MWVTGKFEVCYDARCQVRIPGGSHVDDNDSEDDPGGVGGALCTGESADMAAKFKTVPMALPMYVVASVSSGAVEDILQRETGSGASLSKRCKNIN